MANAHDSLLAGLDPKKSPLGNKPHDLAARRREARRLTELLSSTPSFSFIRLGDMELTYLLALQQKAIGDAIFDDGPTDGSRAYTNPGISFVHARALQTAFERATYVDFHERLWPISELLPKLTLNRAVGTHRNPDAETSYILLTWLEYEFAQYCEGRRVALIGAEAGLLTELVKTAEFRQASAGFWTSNSQILFERVRNDGRNLNDNLLLIKEDLRAFIQANKLDTVFLSLGGASKIICVELAQELGVRMFDAGSMLRALSYSGSDGNRACRSSHFPFLYRIPFSTWCDAMEHTWPELPAHEKLAKVHAQLIVEVQRKEVGWTHASSELDLSEENRDLFRRAHREYLERYSSLFHLTPETRKERASFKHFCGTHQLTSEGIRFFRWFKMKSMARELLRPVFS